MLANGRSMRKSAAERSILANATFPRRLRVACFGRGRALRRRLRRFGRDVARLQAVRVGDVGRHVLRRLEDQADRRACAVVAIARKARARCVDVEDPKAVLAHARANRPRVTQLHLIADVHALLKDDGRDEAGPRCSAVRSQASGKICGASIVADPSSTLAGVAAVRTAYERDL